MPLTAIFSSRRRLVLDLALLLAVVLAIVLVIRGSTGATSTGHAPSRTQVGAAARWLEQIRLPTGATLDRTDTACGVSVELCVTSGGNLRQLAGDLRAALGSQGGTAGTLVCDDITTGCLFFVRYRGVRLGVLVNALRGYRGGSSVALATIQDILPAPTPVRPLPPIASLRAIPIWLHLGAHCLHRLGGGCETSGGRFQRRDGATILAGRWRTFLERSGWLVPPRPCVKLAAGQQCTVTGTRSVVVHGGHFVSIIIDLSDRGRGNVMGEFRLFSRG